MSKTVRYLEMLLQKKFPNKEISFEENVYQCTLSTAWDLSTLSYDSVSHDVGSEDTIPHSIAFSTDGTKMYMVGNNSDIEMQPEDNILYL